MGGVPGFRALFFFCLSDISLFHFFKRELREGFYQPVSYTHLEAIMKQNTGFYQSDLDIDKEIIAKAAARDVYKRQELNNRLVCFDIKQLGKQLKKLGMLIVQDQVWNRVTVNRAERKSTRYAANFNALIICSTVCATLA